MSKIYRAEVNAPAAFVALTPDFVISFTPSSFVIVNEDDTNGVEFSFDGSTVHGRLLPGKLSAIKFERLRYRQIWVQGTGSPSVQVIAEA